MAEQQTDGRTWAWIGKLSALTALAIGVTTLVKSCSAPSIGIQATIERGSLHVPPHYAEFRAKTNATLDSDNIEVTLKKLFEDKDDKGLKDAYPSFAFALSRELREQLKLDYPSLEPTYHGYSTAEITNTGGLTVEDVSLRMPSAKLAIVEREDGTKKADTSGPIIEVGSLGAGQKVQVIVWTDSLFYSSDKPAIYHAGGPGSITIKGEPTFLEFASENASDIILFLFGCFIVLCVSIGILAVRQEAKLKARDAKSKESNTTKGDQTKSL